MLGRAQIIRKPKICVLFCRSVFWAQYNDAIKIISFNTTQQTHFRPCYRERCPTVDFLQLLIFRVQLLIFQIFVHLLWRAAKVLLA